MNAIANVATLEEFEANHQARMNELGQKYLEISISPSEQEELVSLREIFKNLKSEKEQQPMMDEIIGLASKINKPEFVLNQLLAALQMGKDDVLELFKSAEKPVIVGTFKLADYNFTANDEAGNEVFEMVNGKPTKIESFEWDLNERFGGRGWKIRFLQVLKNKGKEHVLEKATPEFKEWLEEGAYTPDKGKGAGNMIKPNERLFFKKMGLDIHGNVEQKEAATPAPAKKTATTKK